MRAFPPSAVMESPQPAQSEAKVGSKMEQMEEKKNIQMG